MEKSQGHLYATHKNKQNTNWPGCKKWQKWQWADQMEAFCPFLSFAKTLSNVSEIPKSNDDTNVQYSENIHKEDSQPQLPENNSRPSHNRYRM